MHRVLPLLLIAGCASAKPELVNSWWFCDGSQSAVDFLVVVGARTEGEVGSVEGAVVQDGLDVGTIELEFVDDTDAAAFWHGEGWEDDLGCDCQSEAMDVRVEVGFP